MPAHRGNQTTEWITAVLAHVKVKAKCELCNLRLSVHEPPDGTSVEAFAILPCGHAFGYECLGVWLQHSPHCPTCRASAKHRRCGHLVTLEKKQQTDKRIYLEMMDPADFPSRCFDCRHRERRERREREAESRASFL